MRRSTIVRFLGGGLAAVVAIGAGSTAAMANGDTRIDGQYRVATVAVGDVDETLSLSGSVANVTRRDQSFAVSGTIDSISVAIGQHVDAGAVLATLDADSLQSALDSANTTLADAQQRLQTDLTAQSSSSSSSGSSGGAAASTVTVDSAALQQAIAALTAAQSALAACDTSDPGGSPTDDPSDDPTDDPSPDPTDSSSCTTVATQQIQTALQSLQSASHASSSGQSGGAQSPSGSSQGSSSTPTASDIASDRAAITAAEAQVEVAQHDYDARTLTASVAGTVAAVGFAVGDSVSAGSSSQVVTIIGDDGYEISTTVSLTKIPKVKVGETATVTLPALGKTYQGTVSAVGVTNVSTDSSTPSYDVTIDIDAAGDAIRYGSAASITVNVASVTGVLTVPLSAVTTSGSTSTVKLLKDGKVSTVTVQAGTMGTELIEIVDGLSAGDEVVLADLSEGVPSSTSTSRTGRTGVSGLTGTGNFPGVTGGFTGGTGGGFRRNNAGGGN